MEKFNRAVRRHHAARLKHNRRFYWGYGRNGTRRDYAEDGAPLRPLEMSEHDLGRVVQTPQTCSCLGCGNQRHNTAGWCPTLQEKRWGEQYHEQVQEAEEDLNQA